MANLELSFGYIVGVDGLLAEVAQGVSGGPGALAGLVRSVPAWLDGRHELTELPCRHRVPITLVVWRS